MEKSQRLDLKSCGLGAVKDRTKHPGRFFPGSAAFQATQDESVSQFTWNECGEGGDKPLWFCGKSKYVSVCVSLCFSVSVRKEVCVICYAAAPAGPGTR